MLHTGDDTNKLLFGSHANSKWQQTDFCLLTEQKKLVTGHRHNLP